MKRFHTVKKQLVVVVASSALIVTGMVAGVASPPLGAPRSPVLRDITVGPENFIGESALTIHEEDAEQPRGESKTVEGMDQLLMVIPTPSNALDGRTEAKDSLMQLMRK